MRIYEKKSIIDKYNRNFLNQCSSQSEQTPVVLIMEKNGLMRLGGDYNIISPTKIDTCTYTCSALVTEHMLASPGKHLSNCPDKMYSITKQCTMDLDNQPLFPSYRTRLMHLEPV